MNLAEIDLQAAEAPPGRPNRPPRLLLTLLGDYWWRQDQPLPSAALVALLGEFGVGDTAARAALSRLVRRDLLRCIKTGRRTSYRLSDHATEVLEDGARRILEFGTAGEPWDGRWSVVTFSIPERDRQSRGPVRQALRWLGFAPLYDAVWVSPRDRVTEALQAVQAHAVENVTGFRATAAQVRTQGRQPQDAWDLDAVRAAYGEFLDELTPLRARLDRGAVPPDEALVLRTRLMDRWRAFPAIDPELPAQLLPADWPCAPARKAFIAMYDALAPGAERRVRQVIDRYAPELAQLAQHHSFAGLAHGPGR